MPEAPPHRRAPAKGAEVLFISHDASGTGAPFVLLLLLGWLKEHSDLKARIVLAAGGSREADFRALAPTYNVSTGEGRAARLLLQCCGWLSWRLRRWLELRLFSAYLARHPVQLVYSNTITNGELLARLPEQAPPVLTHVHELGGMFQQCQQLGHLQHTLKRSTHFVAVADAVVRELVDEWAVAPEKVSTVHGFIPLERTSAVVTAQARTRVRAALGLRDDAWLVVGCGQLHARKGPDLFIEVAQRVGDALAPERVTFAWAGGSLQSSEYAQLQASVDRLGMHEHVRFLGHRKDYLDILAAADVFLMTSREDPFPLVVLESAALGVPIVCFDGAGGTPEFVSDDAGVCVGLADTAAMAATCAGLLTDPVRRQALGAKARERALSNHSVAAGASRIHALIERFATGA